LGSPSPPNNCSIVDGKDVYQTAVDLNMYRTIPRTEGVSTTEIVGRMLLMTKDHHDLETPSTGRSRSLSFDLQVEPLESR
jgi:hypothetical protein